MGRNRPKRVPVKNKAGKKSRRMANRPKDLDQIQDEMKNPPALPIDEDLPGLGQFYCITCARYFVSRSVLEDHFKTVKHKRDLKLAKEKPYSVAESEAAAGMAPPK